MIRAASATCIYLSQIMRILSLTHIRDANRIFGFLTLLIVSCVTVLFQFFYLNPWVTQLVYLLYRRLFTKRQNHVFISAHVASLHCVMLIILFFRSKAVQWLVHHHLLSQMEAVTNYVHSTIIISHLLWLLACYSFRGGPDSEKGLIGCLILVFKSCITISRMPFPYNGFPSTLKHEYLLSLIETNF